MSDVVLVSVVGYLNARYVLRLFRRHRRQRFSKSLFRFFQCHAVLRPARSSEARLYRRQIEFESVAEDRIGGGFRAEQSLSFRIGLDKVDVARLASSELQIIQCFRIDRKETDCRAIFGRHIADRGAIGEA